MTNLFWLLTICAFSALIDYWLLVQNLESCAAEVLNLALSCTMRMPGGPFVASNSSDLFIHSPSWCEHPHLVSWINNWSVPYTAAIGIKSACSPWKMCLFLRKPDTSFRPSKLKVLDWWLQACWNPCITKSQLISFQWIENSYNLVMSLFMMREVQFWPS